MVKLYCLQFPEELSLRLNQLQLGKDIHRRRISTVVDRDRPHGRELVSMSRDHGHLGKKDYQCGDVTPFVSEWHKDSTTACKEKLKPTGS